MIDLFNIKKYNEYDFIQATAPTVSGTWLCSEGNGTYIKGYSYQVTIGTPTTVTRIEVQEDLKIQSAIYPTIESVCQYLNNYFPVKRQANDLYATNEYICGLNITESRELSKYLATYGNYLFQNNQINGVQQLFLKDDLIRLQNAVRNNYISYVTAVTGTTITVDNALFADTIEDCRITLMRLAQPVEQAICEMIYFDTFTRGAASDLKSENIGNYSYTKEDVQIGSLAYPQELTSILMPFKMVRFVQ